MVITDHTFFYFTFWSDKREDGRGVWVGGLGMKGLLWHRRYRDDEIEYEGKNYVFKVVLGRRQTVTQEGAVNILGSGGQYCIKKGERGGGSIKYNARNDHYTRGEGDPHSFYLRPADDVTKWD